MHRIILSLWAMLVLLFSTPAQIKAIEVRGVATGIGISPTVSSDLLPVASKKLYRPNSKFSGFDQTDGIKSETGMQGTYKTNALRPDHLGSLRVAAAELPNTFASRDWTIETDPTANRSVRIRFEKLPKVAGAPIRSVRLRSGFHLIGIELPPKVGIWHRVERFNAPEGVLGAYSIQAVSSAGLSRWSKPKLAATAWWKPPKPPQMPRPSDWFVRPTGGNGRVLIEVVRLPHHNGAPLTRIEARSAPSDLRFAPQEQWSPWKDITDEIVLTGHAGLSGLSNGQLHVIELRALNSLGASSAATRKIVTPSAFHIPTHAIIGELNPPETGRIRIPKGDQLLDASTTEDWATYKGTKDWDYIAPRRPASQLSDRKLRFSSGHSLRVTIKTATFAAETVDDLATFMKLPPAKKSGATLLIGPEWINVGERAKMFYSAHSHLSAPLVVRPREPELSTLISGWTVHETKPGIPAGNLQIEGIRFFHPEALASGLPPPRLGIVLNLGLGRGSFRDIHLKHIQVFSDAMPSRLGYVTDRVIRAINMGPVQNVSLVDSEVAHIAYGVQVGNRNALIRGNTIHHIAADPFNLHFRRGTKDHPTIVHDIVIENNTAFDFMGDASILHSDGIHIWMHGAGKAGPFDKIERLAFRGNIIFPGWEGIQKPPQFSAWLKMTPLDSDRVITIADDHKLLRVDASSGPVTITLPRAKQTSGTIKKIDKELVIGIQKIDTSTNPVVILRNEKEINETKKVNSQAWVKIVLTAPYRGVELRARPAEGNWKRRDPVPGLQGFFADHNQINFSDSSIEANILWGQSPNQILPRNEPQNGFTVHHNSVLLPLPGDLDGDGRFNTTSDGVQLAVGNVALGAWDDSVMVWANVARKFQTNSGANGKKPHLWNNASVNWAKSFDRLEALFPNVSRQRRGDVNAVSWFPETRAEAILFARPKTGSDIDKKGQGAVSAQSDRDWWDFELGKRNPSGLPALEIASSQPSLGGFDVPADIKAIDLVFNLPIASMGGIAQLVRQTDKKIVADWRFDEAASKVQRAGPIIRLPLHSPLSNDETYTLVLSKGAIVDQFGQSFIGLPADGTQALHFKVSKNAAWNLLGGKAKLEGKSWELFSADKSLLRYKLISNSQTVIRLDSQTSPQFLLSGQHTLRFDYRHVPGRQPVTMYREMGNDSSTWTINWDTIAVGRKQRLNSTVSARRTDISSLYGDPPKSWYTAEVTWTPSNKVERLLIDAIRIPAARGIFPRREYAVEIARLMLHKGRMGRLWSPPL